MPRPVTEIFSARATLGHYLQIEAALALSQAELGLIPLQAASVIGREADPARFDCDEIVRKSERTGYAVAPLVRELTARCGEAGGFVHWGATTQDIVCTTLALQINEAMSIMRDRLASIAACTAKLAQEHRFSVMAARTFGTHALPITFGFKSAVWLAAFLRRIALFDAWLSEPMEGEFSGVAGTLASLGDNGPDVRRNLMRRLGLGEALITWAPMHDRILDSAMCIAGAAACAGKVAQDIAELSMTELGELAEPVSGGRDASSTLPFKANPIHCAHVTSAATRVAQGLGTLLVAFRQRQERSAEGILEYEVLPELFLQCDRCLGNLDRILCGLEVHADRMRANLDATRGLLVAERYMMSMAPHLGRLAAHDLIHEASLEAVRSGSSLCEVLMKTDAVRQHMGDAELRSLADPSGYLGQASSLIDAVLQRAREMVHPGDKDER